MHAITDKKMDEYIVMHCSKKTEEERWNVLNFRERNFIACEHMDLIYRCYTQSFAYEKFLDFELTVQIMTHHLSCKVSLWVVGP